MQPFKLTHNSRRAVIRQTGNGVWPGNRGSNSTSSVLNDKLRHALRSLNDSVYQYGVYFSKIIKQQWLATAIFFQICRRLKYIDLILSESSYESTSYNITIAHGESQHRTTQDISFEPGNTIRSSSYGKENKTKFVYVGTIAVEVLFLDRLLSNLVVTCLW